MLNRFYSSASTLLDPGSLACLAFRADRPRSFAVQSSETQTPASHGATASSPCASAGGCASLYRSHPVAPSAKPDHILSWRLPRRLSPPLPAPRVCRYSRADTRPTDGQPRMPQLGVSACAAARRQQQDTPSCRSTYSHADGECEEGGGNAGGRYLASLQVDDLKRLMQVVEV
eukprot:753921-Hanusia_phi.AAC.4